MATGETAVRGIPQHLDFQKRQTKLPRPREAQIRLLYRFHGDPGGIPLGQGQDFGKPCLDYRIDLWGWTRTGNNPGTVWNRP